MEPCCTQVTYPTAESRAHSEERAKPSSRRGDEPRDNYGPDVRLPSGRLADHRYGTEGTGPHPFSDRGRHASIEATKLVFELFGVRGGGVFGIVVFLTFAVGGC